MINSFISNHFLSNIQNVILTINFRYEISIFADLEHATSKSNSAKMKSKISTIFFLISIFIDYTFSAKILVLHPSPSKSHVLVTRPLVFELARHHQVTMFSQFPSNKKMENLREFKVEVNETINDFAKDLVKKTNKLVQFFQNMPRFVQLCTKGGEEMIQHPELQRFMKTESFDLVIVGLFITPFMFGVADHFKCPQIGIWSAGTFSNINMVGFHSYLNSLNHMMEFFRLLGIHMK